MSIHNAKKLSTLTQQAEILNIVPHLGQCDRFIGICSLYLYNFKYVTLNAEVRFNVSLLSWWCWDIAVSKAVVNNLD